MIFLRDFEVSSSALNDHRMVTVFAPNAIGPAADSPVVFCADGHAVLALAAGVSREIASGNLPDVTLIGAHTARRQARSQTLEFRIAKGARVVVPVRPVRPRNGS